MKPSLSNSIRLLALLALTACMPGPRASAQTPAGLTIQTYAGLTITGAVGAVYSIDYVTDLAQTNTPSAWRCLEFLPLPVSPYLWTDKSAPATGRRFYRAVASQPPTNMVFIPPGTFRMGSPTNEVDRELDEGSTVVAISKGFWMGKHEVTQSEFLAVTGANPSWFQGDLNCPVEGVSWHDATNYCGQFTRQERAAGRIATNSVYRLPTEAEWEYACRAWTSDRRFSYGDDPGYTNLTDYAWYDLNSSAVTSPAGQKLPNPWGLYDMHGNVWEWCQDWYGVFSGRIAYDPQGPATGLTRVIRGGAWDSTAALCRSAARLDAIPELWDETTGFRVVLAPGQP